MDRQALRQMPMLAVVALCTIGLAACFSASVATPDVRTPDWSDIGLDTAGLDCLELPKPAGNGVPKVLVGGSDADGQTFVDWASGAVQAKVISGPQGGQHIWVSVQASNLWPVKLRMVVQMFDVETGELVKPGKVEITHTMNPTCGPWFTYTGMPSFVKEPCKINGRKLRVHLEASDLYGLAASSDAFIVAQYDGFCSLGTDAFQTDATQTDADVADAVELPGDATTSGDAADVMEPADATQSDAIVK